MDYFLLSYLHGIFSWLYVGGIEGTVPVLGWKGWRSLDGLQEAMWEIQLGSRGKNYVRVTLRVRPVNSRQENIMLP